MKQDYEQKYEGIRALILKNFSNVKDLLNEAESLSKIIDDLDPVKNKDMKGNLEKLKKNIDTTISNLLSHLDLLFNAYDALLADVYNKR